ncbi:Transcription elongation factor B polypeptide 3 [Armadillidium nasatum]|uniref:Transcription elongation factor B polypeptide 3 n=1 Tax=Armadillidium nasatum TaxID=96803 RepID=A0A5N5SY60_9CRUS|nr:Transcription elongation factor B polypeptide 3 [Armadillidium nasatum]
MVAQEEEQQEANEELESYIQDADVKSQTSNVANNDHIENEEEYDPSDEGDRLQIEEDNGEESYNPGGLNHMENDEEPCNGYDPRTSREDYLSFNTEPNHEYTPTSKYSASSQDVEESDKYSPLVPNGFETEKKEKSHKSKEESKHKKKKHKSRHDKEEKHKIKEETSNSKKSKHKSPKKEKEKDSKSSKSSASHSSSKSHSSSHKSDKIKTVDIKSASSVSHNSHSNNDSTSLNNSSSGKGLSDSSDKKRRRELEDEVESPSRKKSKVSDDHKEKKSHKSKSSKEDHKSSKKRKELETSCEFEAALMGMEGTSSKKKKKKAKEKETEKDADETYSPSIVAILKDFKFDSRDQLPNLPSSFEDDIEAPQLMTHYKPLPQVPQRSTSRDPFTSSMTDEEALNFMLSSKNSKQRRIYAGKATPLSSVPSLFDTCIRVLQENIDALEFMGGIPFDILKPVIEKATPQQLFSLEDYNPYLLEDTDVLWAAHCRKSFKNKQREDMETWRDMFIRCTDEHQEKMRTVTENLQKKYITKAPPKRTTQLAFINTVAKLPKSVARAQARYGTSSSVPTRHTKAEEQLKASSSNNSSSSTSSGGSSIVPKVEKPMPPNKPPAVKKPKVAPLMGKARQLMKKVCRR